MTQSKDNQNHLFNPGKARWLQEKGAQDLTDNQQALLLALAKLETELGRELSEEETAALEAIAQRLEGYDSEDITTAIRDMVNKPADPKRKTSWPELKKRRKE